jgi:hypothetical protein
MAGVLIVSKAYSARSTPANQVGQIRDARSVEET